MGEGRTLQRTDLRRLFDAPPGRTEAVGLEVEVGLIARDTRRNASYPQAQAVLNGILRQSGGTPLMDGAYQVGVALPNGAAFTLETGGALEYSSPPFPTVAATVADVRASLHDAARIADRHGVALLTGGIIPFTRADGVAWNPKPRVRVMRDYFRRLGTAGAHADEVMSVVLSAQTSLDYTSADDLMTKLRLMIRASPIVAALFVASPVAENQDSGALSRRMQYWRHFDPRRCGVLACALNPDAGIDDLVDWVARLPMIYRLVGGSHVAAPAISFIEALEHGFGDGTRPTLADWELHLNQVWPHVRVRRTLELRLPDAPPWPWFGAGAALWTGLTYDSEVRRIASGLLSDLTAEDVDRASQDVAVKGLSAMIGPYPVHDLARQLLRLSRQGLRARVDAGVEPPEVLSLLDPVDEVCETMRTFAHSALDAWHHGEETYLTAFTIPSE